MEWARELLTRYREALLKLERAGEAFSDGYPGSEDPYDAALAEANRLNPIAWKVVKDLYPEVSDYDHNLNVRSQVRNQRNDVNKALGVLDLEAELEENWVSEPTATLDTSRLRRWVWDPARELWEIGRYREALHTAAVTVNSHLQAKVDRDDEMEFSNLARNVFRDEEPWPGNPRLRFADSDDWGEQAASDFHRGAAALGEAVFLLWRNVPAHKLFRIDEQIATEALAALSTFARMVESSEVMRTQGDGPELLP